MRGLPDTTLPAEALEIVFDQMRDVAFFVKDAAGCYVHVNQSWVTRCGVTQKSEIIGCTARDLFPSDLAQSYERQDREVLTGEKIVNKLELHWQRRGRPGWCLTTKLPLFDAEGRITGLVGVSRDLPGEGGRDAIPSGVAKALDHLEAVFADSRVLPSTLAEKAGMNLTRFARHVKRIFQLTPGQLIGQKRLEAAARMLRSSKHSVAHVALECGYCDHSAFTRAFKEATGMTPKQFRESAQG